VLETSYFHWGILTNCKKALALTLQINEQSIQNVKSCKLLGTLIDNDLRWKDDAHHHHHHYHFNMKKLADKT